MFKQKELLKSNFFLYKCIALCFFLGIYDFVKKEKEIMEMRFKKRMYIFIKMTT